MVAPAACFLFAAQIESRVMPVLWGSALGIEWVIGVPGGLTLPLRQAMFATLPAVATLVAGVFALALSWRQPRPRWMIAPACIGLIAGGILLGRARAQHRYPVFAALCEQPPAFVMHAIKRAYAGAWPIWRELDDGVRHRIAVTAGWDGVGHNVFRHPLLGSDLQNRVFYVPITGDGSIVDYERGDEVRRRADAEAWLARLTEQQIDVVVLLDPRPPEAPWIETRPERFERIAAGIPGTGHAAYRFRPQP